MGLIHSSLQGGQELAGGVTVSTGSPIFQLMSDGSDILYTPNIKKTINENKNKNENENENENKNEVKYNIEESESLETNEVLYPMFINEAAYNEKDIAFVLMSKIELDVQTLIL